MQLDSLAPLPGNTKLSLELMSTRGAASAEATYAATARLGAKLKNEASGGPWRCLSFSRFSQIASTHMHGHSSPMFPSPSIDARVGTVAELGADAR